MDKEKKDDKKKEYTKPETKPMGEVKDVTLSTTFRLPDEPN